MKEDKSWSEEELRDLILFTQELRDENEELRSKVIAMDAMIKNREATLKKAYNYIKFLEKRYEEYEKWNINLN